MKKLLVGLILLVPFFAKADTQLFYFMNGNGYDLTGQLQTYKLMDGSCYNVQDIQVDCLTDVPITPTSTSVTIVPIQNQVQNLPPQTVVVVPVQPVILPTSTPATSTPVDIPSSTPATATPPVTPVVGNNPQIPAPVSVNLTNVSVSNVVKVNGDGYATFNWTTDKYVQTRFWLGKSSGNYTLFSDATPAVGSQSAVWGGLANNTNYYSIIVVTDNDGFTATSTEQSFTTLP